jgi:uncharacterized protein YycO
VKNLLKNVTRYEPVVVAFTVTATPLVGAFVVSVTKAAESGSSTATALAIITGVGSLIAGLAAAWARANVSPVKEQRARRRRA